VRHVRMLGICLLAAFAVGAVAAVPAMAEEKPLSQKQLEKLYAPFSACPYNNPEVSICVHAQTAGGKNGGQFTVGSITIPLSKKITLQGGLTEAGYTNETELQGFIPPENGEETLVSAPLNVPGGFVHRISPQPFWPTALKESYENAKKNKELTATETLELAGTPELSPDNLLVEEGTAFELPMKVHVNSPWLATLDSGPCYVGSNEHPIMVDLTSGESTGPFPYEYNTGHGLNATELHFKDNFDYVELLGSTLVNNTYAVTTGAEGCGGEFERYIDPAVSAAAGVPDASGANSVILTGTQKVSVSERVKEVIG
jgi:hypothetical protein